MFLVHNRLDYAIAWQMPDVYLFTANAIRTRDGRLVMGAGAAKQVRDSYPGIDRQIPIDKPVTYVEVSPGQWLGRFQVKDHWQDAARLDLIEQSARILAAHAIKRPNVRFHLNAPGVGNGRLSWTEVFPLLQALPSNVLVYLC